ncbi:MAG: hypothetical protein MK161_13825, partial [Pirellulales bacterium]|nr:hypothetical protein [Pirellulales bacterium]
NRTKKEDLQTGIQQLNDSTYEGGPPKENKGRLPTQESSLGIEAQIFKKPAENPVAIIGRPLGSPLREVDCARI